MVEDFIAEFREQKDDTARSIPNSKIINLLNTSLRKLARYDGLDKLFERRDTFELSTINKDGTPAAAWDLGKLGVLLDVPNMRVLCATDSQVKTLPVTYIEYKDFFNSCGIPEQNEPGVPSVFTIEQLGSINRLLFDRPPAGMVAVDLHYSAYHPRITSVQDELMINYAYWDILITYCNIFQDISATDDSSARALYEDLDKEAADLKELLARRKSGLPYRRIVRSF